jgi:hypothetical protein
MTLSRKVAAQAVSARLAASGELRPGRLLAAGA